ncbi:galactose oxidase early set domain-containing protein [Acidobacteria bacterium AH-259-G07]|nr:galactose oxidase early set domain-containing protein [Acidobacteria bacterium AH-259-G07]
MNPTWQTIRPMSYRRSNVNVVILPDSKVLVSGGGTRRRGPQVLPCELFDTSVNYMDPAINPWTTVASLNARRQYHSTCVLLPDGRVLAGGNDTGSRVMSLEAYRPPYWFRGPRPRIWYAPTRTHIGSTFTIDSPDAPHVDRAVLVRPMADTHHTDSEQRLLNLPIMRRGRCSLRVRAPANHRLAPPGYYMLFLVNTSGVPSVADFIEIHYKWLKPDKAFQEAK